MRQQDAYTVWSPTNTMVIRGLERYENGYFPKRIYHATIDSSAKGADL